MKGLICYGLAVALAATVYLPIEDWDEARRGINALAMHCRGDYLDYYFVDRPDTFNTKPPLFLWSVALSFKVFGPGVVALRLPSLLALAGFLVYVGHWMKQYYGRTLACMVLTVLVSVRGIIGYHVGTSGDTDMLFTCLLTVACLEHFSYLQGGRSLRLSVAIVAGWLAFLTKGVAVVLVVPGVLLATLLYPQLRRRISSRTMLVPTALLLFLAAAAVLLLHYMGRTTLLTAGYANLLEATFLRDGVQRLTDPGFERQPAPFFVFQALDIRFGPPIYVLYAALFLLPLRYGLRPLLARVRKDRLAVYAGGIAGSVLLLLHLSANKHNWYVAPALPFLAYLFVRAYRALVPERRWQWAGLGALLLFTAVQRAVEVVRADPHLIAIPPETRRQVRQARQVTVGVHTAQHVLFEVLLLSQDPCSVRLIDEPPGYDHGSPASNLWLTTE